MLKRALNDGIKAVRINLSDDWVIEWSCDVFFFPLSLFLACLRRAVGSQAGRDVVRKLSDDNDDAVAEKCQRGPGVQRLWPVL